MMHSQAAGGAAHHTPRGSDLWNETNGSAQLEAKFLAKVFLADFWKVPGKRIFGRFGWYKIIWCFGLLPQP